jgi:hypothetical protein
MLLDAGVIPGRIGPGVLIRIYFSCNRAWHGSIPIEVFLCS